MRVYNWNEEIERFRKLTRPEKVVWFSQLLFLISMFARDSYEPGTDGVSRPRDLRRYNELLHRIAAQQLKLAKEGRPAIPDETMFLMLEEETLALGIDAEEIIKRLP
jgi:hypothetical protein